MWLLFCILQCIRRVKCNSLTFSYILQVFQSHFYFYGRLIELSGDVENNPGPNSKPDQSFSIYHWNLNSIAAHNFLKIHSLIAYNCLHHFDIFCLSKLYLNSEISSDNKNLDIPGFRLMQFEHPSNDKWGGVCIYFKFSLPIQILSISFISLMHQLGDFFFNWDSLHARLNSHYKGRSYKKQTHKKIKTCK